MLAMQHIVESRRKKVVGESYEEKPHVRFEAAGEGSQDMVLVLRHSHRKRRTSGLPHLSPRRHFLTLQADRGCGTNCILLWLFAMFAKQMMVRSPATLLGSEKMCIIPSNLAIIVLDA